MGVMVGCDVLGYDEEKVKKYAEEFVVLILDCNTTDEFVNKATAIVGNDPSGQYTVGYVLGSYLGTTEHQEIARIFEVLNTVFKYDSEELAVELASKIFHSENEDFSKLVSIIAVEIFKSESPDEFMQNVLSKLGNDGVNNPVCAYAIGFVYGVYLGCKLHDVFAKYFTTVEAIKRFVGEDRAKQFVGKVWDLAKTIFDKMSEAKE